MDRHSNARSSLFLIELIIAILFFSLGAAICVQAFVKAHTLTVQARDLAFASSTVSSAANVLRCSDASPEQFAAYFPGAAQDAEGVLFVCYGEDFAPCGEEEAAYVLRAETAAEGPVRACHITMGGQAGAILYELDLRWPEQEAAHG